VAAWGKLQIDNSLAAAGTSAAAVGLDKLGQVGVLYHGLAGLGGGSILAGLVLGAIGVFVIDRNFQKAAAFSFAGATLTFFGFMHGEAIGVGETPVVAVSYLAVGAIMLGCAKFAVAAPRAVLPLEESGGTEIARAVLVPAEAALHREPVG
jgi:AGZA family xanthine/uracil permease-like MFS transporter